MNEAEDVSIYIHDSLGLAGLQWSCRGCFDNTDANHGITGVISQEVECHIKIRWLPSRQVHSYERIELVMMIIGLKVPDYPGAFSPRGIVLVISHNS